MVGWTRKEFLITYIVCWMNKPFKNNLNTPGTAGGPGGRDRTLAVKIKKNAKKIRLPKKIFFAYIF